MKRKFGHNNILFYILVSISSASGRQICRPYAAPFFLWSFLAFLLSCFEYRCVAPTVPLSCSGLLLLSCFLYLYPVILSFPSYLFWDTDPSLLDPVIHRRYIIGRVASLGNLQQWNQLLSEYGTEIVREEVKHIRDLDVKTANYLSHYFTIPPDEFACFSSTPFPGEPDRF
jgi:hypothetical protein